MIEKHLNEWTDEWIIETDIFAVQFDVNASLTLSLILMAFAVMCPDLMSTVLVTM